MASKHAPPQLELVQDFVNTWDEGVERLGSPAALADWLHERGLLDAREAAQDADLRRALAVREALREVLLRHGGHVGEVEEPGTVLDEAARRAGLRVAFTADADARVVVQAGGVDGALGRVLAVAHAAQVDGTWERLKACADPTCRWAFYDRTRNHSGRWCDMADCGNRAKARTFRERHGAGG
jgi:predicted RNA-binding Zn ribbon-like protein